MLACGGYLVNLTACSDTYLPHKYLGPIIFQLLDFKTQASCSSSMNHAYSLAIQVHMFSAPRRACVVVLMICECMINCPRIQWLNHHCIIQNHSVHEAFRQGSAGTASLCSIARLPRGQVQNSFLSSVSGTTARTA